MTPDVGLPLLVLAVPFVSFLLLAVVGPLRRTGRGADVGLDPGRRRADCDRRGPGRPAQQRDARPGDPGVAPRPDLFARVPRRRTPRAARSLLHVPVALRLLDAG